MLETQTRSADVPGHVGRAGTALCLRETGVDGVLWPLRPQGDSRPAGPDQARVAVTTSEVHGDIRENTPRNPDGELGVWGGFSTDVENSRCEPRAREGVQSQAKRKLGAKKRMGSSRA